MSRFPLDDLIALARYTPDELDEIGQDGHDSAPSLRPSEVKIMRRLRISWTTLRRYQAEGLTETQADRLAVRLGFHPINVWPDWGHE